MSSTRKFILAVAAVSAALISSCNGNDETPIPDITVSMGQTTYSVDPSTAVDIYAVLDKPAEKGFSIPVTFGGEAVEKEDFEAFGRAFAFTKGSDRAFISIRNINYGTADKRLTVTLGAMPAGVTSGETKNTTVNITAGDEATYSNYFYIDNGEVRLGIAMDGGGSVFYFAESDTGRNLLNHADKGRYMQQSYYGDPDGSTWNGGPWVWNPIQGGGSDNTPSTILDYELTETSIWVRTMPKLWATSANEPNVIMEEEISLEGKVATVKYRFLYTGSHNHGLRTQELPAFFCDLALPNLVSYDGDAPWTDAKTYSVLPKQRLPGQDNDSYDTTEHWAAYVDDNQWGVGIYFPIQEEKMELTCYRNFGPTGPTGGGCSYFAPVKLLEIPSGLDYRYNVYMTIGNVGDIRGRFKEIRNGNL